MEHRARKRFGQNFLHDQHVIERIVRAIDPRPTDTLIEIGPGLAALTVHVLPLAKKLTCIELDRDVIPIVQEKCAGLGELNLINADVLKVDFAQLSLTPPLRVFGNLPYNISSPLLFHLFDYSHVVSDMTFMLQKEVVERMAATHEEGNYGRLSVMTQYYAQVDYLFKVGPGAFKPAPKVDSAIVRLVPHRTRALPPENEKLFAKIVNTAFSARRKTVRNALQLFADETQLAAAGIDRQLRPENLSVKDYIRLTLYLAAQGVQP